MKNKVITIEINSEDLTDRIVERAAEIIAERLINDIRNPNPFTPMSPPNPFDIAVAYGCIPSETPSITNYKSVSTNKNDKL